MKEIKLVVDRGRSRMPPTNVPIRAWDPVDQEWCTTDISYLNKASLLTWLKSRDGDNKLAEDLVGILMGHGHLHN
jgi:hypothetical protein